VLRVDVLAGLAYVGGPLAGESRGEEFGGVTVWLELMGLVF